MCGGLDYVEVTGASGERWCLWSSWKGGVAFLLTP